jgi:hypothetical protein
MAASRMDILSAKNSFDLSLVRMLDIVPSEITIPIFERRVIFTGVAKYDRPHLSVTKTLDGIVEETLPWGRGEEHLAGETKTREVASYTITIENDGNKALGPVYVQDLFPPAGLGIHRGVDSAIGTD